MPSIDCRCLASIVDACWDPCILLTCSVYGLFYHLMSTKGALASQHLYSVKHLGEVLWWLKGTFLCLPPTAFCLLPSVYRLPSTIYRLPSTVLLTCSVYCCHWPHCSPGVLSCPEPPPCPRCCRDRCNQHRYNQYRCDQQVLQV